MTQSKQNKTNKSKKGIIIGAIAGVVILALIIAFFTVTGSATSAAFLNIEAGDVQVDTGKGWMPATDGMELDLNDKIKTGAGGEASVILYESAIVSLEPNTEISIAELSDENVAIKQSSGSTWNKFTGLSGLKGMEVETPNAVATVRGTEFGVGMDDVQVMEGTVDTEDKESGETLKVPAGKMASRLEGKLALSDLSEEQYNKLITKMEKNIVRMQNLREKEIAKHPRVVGMLESKLNMNDEQLRQKLKDVDKGRQTLDEEAIMKKAPMKMESLQKVVRITQKIQEQNKAIDELKNRIPPAQDKPVDQLPEEPKTLRSASETDR
jgi:hypothetical protein